MKIRTLAPMIGVAGLLLCSTSVLAQPVTTAQSDGAPPARGTTLNTLVDQTAQCDTFGSTSQFFTDFSGGSELADDFTVPAGSVWSIQEVNAPGFYTDVGTTSTVNVRFFDDTGASGLPGNLVCEAAGVTVASGAADGNYVVDLSGSPCTLTEGNYWFSIQAELAFNGADQWFWFNGFDNNALGRAFQDTADLFGTGCTAWDFGDNCLTPNANGANDQCFALAGSSSLALPESVPVPTGDRFGYLILLVSLLAVGGIVLRLRS